MYAKTLIDPALIPAPVRPLTPWVERRCNLDVEEFAACYLRPRRPVVLTDALREWQALRVFTPNFFRQRFANAAARSGGCTRALGEMIDRQLAPHGEKPGLDPCTLAVCTELLPYVTPRFPCSLPSRDIHGLVPSNVSETVNRLEIVFAGRGSCGSGVRRNRFGTHRWFAQVYGEKEITLYAAGQEHLLYVDTEQPWRSRARDAGDDAGYPLLQLARRQRLVLRAGEALFVPSGTWYAVESPSMSITVAFDQLESSNWSAFADAVVAERRECGRPLRAAAYGAWLRLLGPVLRAREWFGASRATDWGSDDGAVWKAARRCTAYRF